MKLSKCNHEEKEAVSMTENIKEKTDVCSKVKGERTTTKNECRNVFLSKM